MMGYWYRDPAVWSVVAVAATALSLGSNADDLHWLLGPLVAAIAALIGGGCWWRDRRIEMRCHTDLDYADWVDLVRHDPAVKHMQRKDQQRLLAEFRDQRALAGDQPQPPPPVLRLPPAPILLIGCSILTLGTAGLVDACINNATDSMGSVLLLMVGGGLIYGRHEARSCTLALVLIPLVFLIPFTIAEILTSLSLVDRQPSLSHGMQWFWLALAALICAVGVIILQRPSSREWFTRSRVKRQPLQVLCACSIIGVSVVQIPQSLANHRTQAALERMEMFTVTLHLKSADPERHPVRSLSGTGMTRDNPNALVTPRFRQSVFAAKDNSMRLEIRAWAEAPMTIPIHSSGFEPTTVTITPSDWQKTVILTPLPTPDEHHEAGDHAND